MLVVKDPLVLKSYSDIIERRVIPLFPKGMSYDSHFKYAEAESYRSRLWNYAVKKYGEGRLYVDLSPLSFLLVALSILNSELS